MATRNKYYCASYCAQVRVKSPVPVSENTNVSKYEPSKSQVIEAYARVESPKWGQDSRTPPTYKTEVQKLVFY